MRPSISVGNFTADRARGRKSAGGSQTLPCGPRAAGGQRAFRARPLEACRPVGGFGVRDGLKMGLLSMGFRLSGPNWLLHRGDRNPPAGPHWAATAWSRGAEPGHLGRGLCSDCVVSHQRQDSGLRNTGLAIGLTAVREPGAWRGWLWQGVWKSGGILRVG